MSDLTLHERVVETEVLEEVGDVGPAQGVDIQPRRVAQLLNVVAEAPVQVGLGDRQPVGGWEEVGDVRCQRGQPGPDPGLHHGRRPAEGRQH